MQGERWGAWTVVEETDRLVTVQCVCGVRRTFRASQWATKRSVTTLCRRCLIKRENKRMENWFHRTANGSEMQGE